MHKNTRPSTKRVPTTNNVLMRVYNLHQLSGYIVDISSINPTLIGVITYRAQTCSHLLGGGMVGLPPISGIFRDGNGFVKLGWPG